MPKKYFVAAAEIPQITNFPTNFYKTGNNFALPGTSVMVFRISSLCIETQKTMISCKKEPNHLKSSWLVLKLPLRERILRLWKRDKMSPS
jgi:hypothetical protein